MPIQDRSSKIPRLQHALVSVETDQWRVRLLQGTSQDVFGLSVVEDITFDKFTTKHEVNEVVQNWILFGQRPGL